jgi:hypothetical protein
MFSSAKQPSSTRENLRVRLFWLPQHEQTALSASIEYNTPLEGYANLHYKNG